MQAAEAITRLIAIADQQNAALGEPLDHEEALAREEDQVAVHIAQAMLNSMIVVARFRVFVRIESGAPEDIGAEYTVCCTDIKSVKAALRPLSSARRNVYIQVWEQRATGADMLLGFQGATRDMMKGQQSNFIFWLKSLDQFEVPLN